ncbi:LpqN/LpqT family lipoprotein [Mycobacterium sp. SMC-4]|nr:LpqN/LpqT family lipoprotein [Mycobacterium sp. SMC-4]
MTGNYGTTTNRTTNPPNTPTAAVGPNTTLDEYIAQNNLVRAAVLPRDPGSPTVKLPTPEGWVDMGPNTPGGAYSAMTFTGEPPAADPATIVARMFKLTGNADPARVLEVAPNFLRTLPEFEGPETGQSGTLSGFEAVTIGGLYVREGVPRMIAQKTVVIPGQDGLFVLQIDAEGTEEQAYPLMDGTAAIDDQTRITP